MTAGVRMVSLWRNDERRSVEQRAEALLGKLDVDEWLWVVGDSTDNTETMLRRIAAANGRVTVIRRDTGIYGNTLPTRLRRLSATFNAALEAPTTAPITCLHESDLVTEFDVVEQLLSSNRAFVAGWPTLGDLFYDVWGYRHLDGRQFQPNEPVPPGLIEVSSFGSCWLAPTAVLSQIRIYDLAVVELCRKLRDLGARLWVNPAVSVEQPHHLWEFWDARELEPHQ